jgi:tetratricopeptide (TPR) repeat protein
MRQEYSRALASYDAAVERGANDSLITIRYKVNAWMTAEMEKQPAIDFYRNQLERFPLDYRYYYWLARTYERVGKRFEGPGQEAYQRGIAIAESLLTVNPNDATASSYLGLLLVRYRTDPRSKVLADRAIQLEPHHPSHYYRKANVHAILREKDAALEALREAVKREYSFTEILNPDFDAMKKEPEFTAIVRVKSTQ